MSYLSDNLFILLSHPQLPTLAPQQQSFSHQCIDGRCFHLHPMKHIQLMMLRPLLLLLPDINKERYIPYLRSELHAHLIVVSSAELCLITTSFCTIIERCVMAYVTMTIY